MGLKVISIWEFIISHLFLVAGLILITVGMLNDEVALNIIGIWIFVLGLCLGFGFVFKRLAAK
jgi:uncharacterized membrane protein YiaA